MQRATAATSWPSPYLQINADASANYTVHQLYGSGSAAGASALTSQTGAYYPLMPAANQNANVFGAAIIDILDYANTNKYKTIRSLGGADNNGTGQIEFDSNVWLSSVAINSLSFYPSNGTNFAQYSRFSLYGIKG